MKSYPKWLLSTGRLMNNVCGRSGRIESIGRCHLSPVDGGELGDSSDYAYRTHEDLTAAERHEVAALMIEMWQAWAETGRVTDDPWETCRHCGENFWQHEDPNHVPAFYELKLWMRDCVCRGHFEGFEPCATGSEVMGAAR